MSARDGSNGGEEKRRAKKCISESKRFNRNLSEQKRRNRFNNLVDELAHCVLSKSNVRPKQKLEKSAIFELAVNFLRENQAGQKQKCPSVHGQSSSASSKQLWQPSFLNDAEFIQMMQESLDGFSFVLDPAGKVLHVSDGIFVSLGLTPDQLLNSSILDFVHKEDQETILTHLKMLEDFQKSLQNSMQFKPSTLSFMCRMGGPHLKPDCFALLNCLGRIFPNLENESTGHHDNQGEQTERHGSMCLVVFGKLAFPKLDKTLFTATGNSRDFSYRLAMDWKYIFVDQSAFFIIGFLPTEMMQVSAYEYIHPDDLSNMARYHEMLVHVGQLTTCYYRQITKGSTWIWLRSTCYVSYNQWNSKPDCVVCTATIATYAEVCANQKEILKNDEKRFAKVVSVKSDSSIFSHQRKLMAKGNLAMQEAGDNVGASGDLLSSFVANNFTTNDESGEALRDLQQQTDVITDTLPSPQQPGEICLPDPSLTRGLTQDQLKMHNRILQEQTQIIQESIQNKEQQLQVIQRLMQWNHQLMKMYERVVDAAMCCSFTEAVTEATL